MQSSLQRSSLTTTSTTDVYKRQLQEDAEIGDEVTVVTAANRTEKGTLIEVGPYYTHSYGKFVPEIIEIDKQLREIMFGGDK